MVRAKMRCNSINPSVHYVSDGVTCNAAQVSLSPVYKAKGGNGPDSYHNTENEIFGKATPSGSVTMYITNENAWRQFEVGRDYYVDFSPVEPN